eukprot:2684917-Prymnesium_polylepis.1
MQHTTSTRVVRFFFAVVCGHVVPRASSQRSEETELGGGQRPKVGKPILSPRDALNPYTLRNIMQQALVAHRSPPARSEPNGTFSKFRLVGRVLAGRCVF